MSQFIARQGDIIIIQTNRVPGNAKPVSRDNGRIVLAYGERTGHAHTIDSPDATFLAADLDEMTDRFLRVSQECGQVDSWETLNKWGERCWFPAYVSPDLVAAAGYRVVDRAAIAGVVVEHNEHLPYVVPPGDMVVRRQVEYRPEAIRIVSD